MTISLSSYAGGGLNQADVDARVVAIASGIERVWLKPGIDFHQGSGSPPTLTENVLLGGSYYYGNTMTFSASAIQNSYGSWKFPARWNAGSLRFRFYWKGSTTNTGNVQWLAHINTVSAVDSAAIGSGITSGQTVLDAGTTAGYLQISAWTPAQSMTTPNDEGLQNFIFQRTGTHANDTYTGTADLIGVEMEWTSNTPTDT